VRRLLRWIREPELIGPPDCPIMRRWTIYGDDPKESLLPFVRRAKRFPYLCDRKLLLHFFEPNVEDRDPHDHPRGFWTIVLRGSYLDLVPCPDCRDRIGVQFHAGVEEPEIVPPKCDRCGGEQLVVGDVMRAGAIRYRPAKHTHITQSGPNGAWTLVLMGPFERSWGFLRRGRWWAFRDYEAEFGFAMRCPTDEEREGVILKYSDQLTEKKETTG
jgi:hypothetical protein